MLKKISIILGLLILVSNIGYAAEITETLTLEKAIDLALENSLELKQAKREYKQQKKELEIYENKYNGNFRLNVGSNYAVLDEVGEERGSLFNDKTELKLSSNLSPTNKISLSQSVLSYNDEVELLSGGSLQYQHYLLERYDFKKEYNNELLAKEVALFAQKKKIKEIKKRIEKEIVEKYYGLLELKENKKIQAKHLEKTKWTLDLVKQKVEVGEAAKFDQQEAKLEVERQELNLDRLESEYEMSLLELADRLGVNLSSDIELTASKKQEFALSKNEFAEKVKDSNLGLSLLNKRIKKQKKRLDYLAGGKNFMLKAIGEIGWNNKGYKDDYCLGLEFNYNFNSFQQEVDEKEFKREENWLTALKEDLTRLEQDLRLEINREYNNLENLRRELEFSKQEVENVKELLSLAEKKYEKGMISLSELFRKQCDLLETESSYFKSLFDYNLQVYKLKMMLK